MRPIPPGSPRRRPKACWFLAVLAGVGLLLEAKAQAQASKKAVAPDFRPLARYVPRDGLIAYLGTEGLDSQADAWKKTSAYKLLTETNLGVMLEDMTSQAASKALERLPNSKLTGADVLAVTKHLARFGFVAAMNHTPKGAEPTPPSGTLVIRAVMGKDAVGGFGRLIGALTGAVKTQKLSKNGRYVVIVPIGVDTEGKPKATWTWWVEKDTDLVVAFGKGAEDLAMAVIDGKTPNAVDHPIRAELARAEGGFIPIGQFFIDPAALPKTPPLAAAAAADAAGAASAPPGVPANLTPPGLTRVDYRWGFQDEALMSIARIKAPRPRMGTLALFDQPTFDKGKLPALPEGLESFTVASLDFGKLYDQAMAGPASPNRANLAKLTEDLKASTRLDLRKDVLAHLDPKFAIFVMPGANAPATPAVPASGAVALAKAASPLGGLLGAAQLPRFTLAAEVDDNAAAAKALDNLMNAFNKASRDHAAETAEPPAAEAPKGAADSAKGRRTPPPAPEFKATPSNVPTERSYVLNIPSTLARGYPAGFRPTIRLKGKQLVISTTPEAARAALEIKAGAWTPPADLASAFELLPKDLVILGARDPRSSLPEILAKLPGSFQAGVNAVIAKNQVQAADAQAGPGATSPARGSAKPNEAMLVFKIPETRMPKVEELRERLSPGSFAVSSDDQEIRVVSRVAFPNLIAPAGIVALAMPAIQAARNAGRAASAAPGPAAVAPDSEPAAETKKAGPKPKGTTTKGGRSSVIPPD